MQTVKKIGFSLLAVTLAGLPGVSQTTHSPPHGRSATTRVMLRRGYLGVGVVDIAPDRVKALNLKDDSGVEVKRVDENSPASKAGIRENDVILELNRQKMEDVAQFVRSISETSPGTKIDMAVWRNGAKQNLTATLEARSAPMAPWDPDLPLPPMPPMPPTAPDGFPFFIVQAPEPEFHECWLLSWR